MSMLKFMTWFTGIIIVLGLFLFIFKT